MEGNRKEMIQESVQMVNKRMKPKKEIFKMIKIDGRMKQMEERFKIAAEINECEMEKVVEN